MPTYEYRCRDCGEPLEVVQAFTDDPLTVCPACGGELRKVFAAVGIAFKGSGFYKTDSRKAAKSSASSGAESSASSDQKSTPTGSNGDRGSSDGAKPSSSSSSSTSPPSSSSTAASGGT